MTGELGNKISRMSKGLFTIDQMAELFQRDKSTISRHINKIFKEGELAREATVAFFATI